MTSTLRLTKRFTLEMGHALWNYPGACANIHGHSYKLYVTVRGQPKEDIHRPDYGMLCDFKQLKELVNNTILQPFDHSLVLNEKTTVDGPALTGNEIKVHYLPFQPTCENLAAHFAEKLMKALPDMIKLWQLKLYETEKACAEWHREDNL